MKTIINAIQESLKVKQSILSDEKLIIKIADAANRITSCLKDGGKILFCGNGGSAADAQHLAAELSGRFYFDRAPLNAEALHCNTSYLTAVANDYGFQFVYSRLLKGVAKKGDVLVGISTSGNSENIIHAFETAHQMGITTIAFTGQTGGKLNALSDLLINVPANDTPRIQEAHILIGHIICELTENNMFPTHD